MHKRCGDIKGKLKDDSKIKCQTSANYQTDIPEGCPGIKLNCQYLEIGEKFCYLGDTIGAREGTVDCVITRIRNGWSNFRDLVPLIPSRCLPLGAKGRLYFMRSLMLYGSETWPVKEEDGIRL